MASGRSRYRDGIVGTALRELGVPEHRPDFHARLHHRLAEERLTHIAEARRRRDIRRRRLRWSAPVATFGVVAALVLVAIGLPRGERLPGTGPEIATAAAIKARMAAALAAAENLSGEIVSAGDDRFVGREVIRWSFAMTAHGDFRLREIGRPSDIAYDSTAGIERSLNTSASMGGDTVFFAERRGLAPGRPDPGPSDWILQRDFGSVVRALLAAEDPRVRRVVYQGRTAWRLDIPVVPNLISADVSGDRFQITVDRETGLPVSVVELKNGTVLTEVRIEKLAVNDELPPEQFTIDFPPGAEVLRTNERFRRVELTGVEGIVGHAPLVPATVPEGYELTEVAVAEKAISTGTEAANPESRMVVSLSYRRGLDQFLVTTRLRHVPGYPDVWDDPLVTGEGFLDEPERITLSGGALAGVVAQVLIVPRNIPHVWALTDELVVTVGGDLSRAELIAVAQSLQPRR